MKKEKGITLVALVVTIIVLIILAGISINLVLGDNGIITIAKKAKENTELAKIEEETLLNELYTQLETEGSSSGNLPYDSIAKLTEFKTAIANAIEEAGGIKPDTSAETSIFADNIKGILKEATKNATATADDIAEGKTAYVNGELLIGKNKKTIDILEEGYIDTGVVNPGVSKLLTINFKNTYTLEDNARILIKRAELLSGDSAPYVNMPSTVKLSGTSCSFYYWNGAGINSGNRRFYYVVLSGIE